MTGPLLVVEEVSKTFELRKGWRARGRQQIRAVDHVSFTLNRGETLALVGESGCGKSTTGRLILRLIEPDSGVIRFDGLDVRALRTAELRALRRRMQIIFQDPFASLNPRMSIADILAEPLLLHGICAKEAIPARVEELLRTVGLAPHHAARFPHEFSGGQRQRIGVARALATHPDLIVCDEPVSALDVSIQAQVVNLLQDLQAKMGLSYIFIAHDLAVVKHIATHVAVMYLGRIVEIAGKDVLYANPRHPYTRALFTSVPLPSPGLRRDRPLLQGDVPSPLNPPTGCTFHPRCPFAQAICSAQPPPMKTYPDGAQVACHLSDSLPAFPSPPAAPEPARIMARLRRLHSNKTVAAHVAQ